MLLKYYSLILGDMNLVNWILQYDKYCDIIGSLECKGLICRSLYLFNYEG